MSFVAKGIGIDGKKALNVDLWERYYRAAEGHVISFEWVKGHEGHPYNERCDKLAVASAEAAELTDEGFENAGGNG